VWLWVAAAAMPTLCVLVGGWLFWLATDRPAVFVVEPGIAAMLALHVASPFAALALLAPAKLRTGDTGVASRLLIAAVSGGVVTSVLWGLFYCDAAEYWAEDGQSGANIALGLLLLASPLLVGAAMALAYWFALKTTGRKAAPSCRSDDLTP